MKKNLTIVIVAMLLPLSIFAQCKLDYSNYHLVLDEGFEEITVDQLDNTIPNGRGVWQFHHDEPNWGWGDRAERGTYPLHQAILNPNTCNDIDWDPNIYPSGGNNTYGSQFGEYYTKNQVSIVSDPVNIGNNFLRLTAKRIPPCSQTLHCSVYNFDWDHDNNPNTAPIKVDRLRFPNFESGMIQLRRDVSSNTPQGCPWTFDNPTGIAGWDGYTFGMYEIRMKIPPKGDFPAFWLIGPAQINPFEGRDNPRSYSVGFSRNVNGIEYGDGLHFEKFNWDDLAQDFHTYTVVWTPTEISFFFDGRETATFSGPDMQMISANMWGNHSIIASHQVWYYAMGGGDAWEIGEETKMDIDYIRVYKPNNNDYTLPYKTSNEFVNHNTLDNITNYIDVSSTTKVENNPRSIAFDPQYSDKVFYAGEDGRLYYAEDPQGDQSWSTLRQIQFNYSPSLPAALIDGDLIFDGVNGKYLYRGNDGRIQYYVKDLNNNWIHGYIDNNWGTSQYMVANSKACMAVSQGNGSIFYKGTDDQIHYFAGGNGSAHGWIGHNYIANTTVNHYVKNDVVLQEVGIYTEVIYKGNDDRLQTFWIDQSQNPPQYVHGYIDNSGITPWKAKSDPGSVVMGGHGEVFYIGVDNKIQRYYNIGTGWIHETLPYTYNSVSVPNGDYARNSIAYDPNSGKVFYIGQDGRLQYFAVDPNTSLWYHAYADDYWNTNEYLSFSGSSTGSQDYASLIHDPGTDRTYYLGNFDININNSFWPLYHDANNQPIIVDKRNHLRYFVHENCEVQNPDGTRALNRPAKQQTKSIPFSYNGQYIPVAHLAENGTYLSNSDVNEVMRTKLSDNLVYPNPSNTGIFYIGNQIASNSQIQVMDIRGRLVFETEQNKLGRSIDLSNQPNGVYIMVVKNAESVQRQRIIINK